jgi:hypothetical protein
MAETAFFDEKPEGPTPGPFVYVRIVQLVIAEFFEPLF